MLVKIKNREIVELWKALHAVSGQEGLNRRLDYGIARNIDKLKGVVSALEKASIPKEEFEKKRIELVQKHSKKDDDGNPMSLPGNQGVQIADMIEFNKDVENIREETGQSEKDKEIEDLMESEDEVDIYVVPYKYVVKSKKQLTGSQLHGIMHMLEEPSDEDFDEEN